MGDGTEYAGLFADRVCEEVEGPFATMKHHVVA